MKDIDRFVRIIKQVALDVYNANVPMAVVFGKVKAINPLCIVIEQKLTLPESVLIIGESVRAALSVDDNVIMLRQQGGQSYVVVDKKG